MRITKKLGAGVLGGIGGAFVGTVTMVGLHQPREGDDGIGGAAAAMLGIWGGNLGWCNDCVGKMAKAPFS